MRPSPLQKLLALCYPVKLYSHASLTNPVLDLYYYRGQYQLATTDALYSDGTRYRPLVAAFRALKKDFRRIRNVLVLGTGLGSAAHVAAKMGYRPAFTFVDIDAEVLAWASELLPQKLRPGTRFAWADAAAFLETDTGTYDLIVVDVFIGREVPAFITAKPFLDACKAHLDTGGRLVVNYMATQGEDAGIFKEKIEGVFGSVEEIAFGLNRVYLTAA